MRHSVDNLNKPSMKIAAIICVLIIVIVCYFVFFKKNGEMKGTRPASEPVVEVMQVEKRDMMRHVVLSGKTVADANIALAPKYNGRVVKVNANLGDFVHEGDILLVQDTGDLDLSILQQEANTNAATADVTTQEANFHSDYILAERNYNIVEKDYERQKYLYSIGAISQGDLEDNEQIYLAAKAKLEALENQNNSSVLSKQYAAEKSQHATEALRKQRDDMILRAPRDGIIGYRNAEVGSYLNAGSKVFSLVDNSHVFVDCSISENDAAVLENGMNVNVTIDALGKNFIGKLIYVSPAMDETSKTYTARIELDIDKNTVKAGLFARSSIDILQRKDTIFITKEAVISRNGRTFVYVLKEDNTVEERDVKIGLLNDTEEEIISGLNAGDRIVMTNQDRLKDGMNVKIADKSNGEK